MMLVNALLVGFLAWCSHARDARFKRDFGYVDLVQRVCTVGIDICFVVIVLIYLAGFWK